MPLTTCRLFSSSGPRDWSSIQYGLFLGLFLVLSIGSRILSAQDARFGGERVQSAVVVDYKRAGQLYRDYRTSFFDRNSPVSNPDVLSHPPGYSLLWATIFVLGGGDRAMQLFQIFADVCAGLLVFLIAAELLPRCIAAIAALLTAVAPQLTWNSVILLPDTLAVLPILLAIFFLIIAAKRERVVFALLCGCFIGVSCWLRPNGLLLAPFSALFSSLLLSSGRRLRFAGAIILGAVVVIAPLTIRNAIVFGAFVPLSLGAGQTMLEGISDYDREGRFGIPNTDIEIMRGEAKRFGRPDYAETLFGPDGIARERMRLREALQVISAHPFWFAGVIVRRAASMLRLERAPLIAAYPGISRPLTELDMRAALKTISPGDLILSSPQPSTQISHDGQTLELRGDASMDGPQLMSQTITVEQGTDYVLTVPIRVKQGRLSIDISSTSQGRVYARTFADAKRGLAIEEQPTATIRLPFVAVDNDQVRMIVRNGDSNQTTPVAEIGTVALFQLGPASETWTRIPRLILRTIQSGFLTAVALPLMLVGLFALVRARCWSALAVLLLVPAYYLCFQSLLHTEYRYVLGLHYFLFVIVATGIWFLVRSIYKYIALPA